jgi:hypothetical protein
MTIFDALLLRPSVIGLSLIHGLIIAILTGDNGAYELAEGRKMDGEKNIRLSFCQESFCQLPELSPYNLVTIPRRLNACRKGGDAG